MSATSSHAATAPWDCPWCDETVPTGHIIVALTVNSTESLGCFDCAWAAMNNDIESRRTEKPPASEETRG